MSKLFHTKTSPANLLRLSKLISNILYVHTQRYLPPMLTYTSLDIMLLRTKVDSTDQVSGSTFTVWLHRTLPFLKNNFNYTKRSAI